MDVTEIVKSLTGKFPDAISEAKARICDPRQGICG